MSGSARGTHTKVQNGRGTLSEVRKWSGDPYEGPNVVGDPPGVWKW